MEERWKAQGVAYKDSNYISDIGNFVWHHSVHKRGPLTMFKMARIEEILAVSTYNMFSLHPDIFDVIFL